MATNENVNKVIYGNQTVMDITDTTAEESDVASGEVFYKADGARSVGTLNADSAVWGNISGTLSDQTDLQNALNAKQNTLTLPLSTANGGTGNANGYIRTGRKSDTTIGYYATAEGYNTTASGISSHAEGEESIASAAMAHAEGYTTTASGRWSHAEGYQAVASGDRSHAEGYNTTASGEGSHSEGYRTVASGSYSHAEGEATTAGYLHQHVQGVYNDNKSTTLFEVGNGTANNARSNAFEVYSDGHINVNGDIYQNGNLYNKQIYADNGVLGAKNLLPNNATSQTINGVTFTVNANGSVTINGTGGTGGSSIDLGKCTPTSNRYIISGGNVVSGVAVIVQGFTGTHWSKNIIISENAEDAFDIDYDGYDNVNVRIRVLEGTSVSNKTYYPMLRLASDPDDTYVPYAMTNRELTEEKLSISELKTIASSAADFAAFKTAIANL